MDGSYFITISEVLLKTTALLRAVSFLACASSFASNQLPVIMDGGRVQMRGAIAAAACSVSANQSFFVKMGTFRSNQFDGLGSYAPSVPFEIALDECNTEISERITVNFLGIPDGKDPLVLQAGGAVNSASGVGVAIFDSDGNIIRPNGLPHEVVYRKGEERSLHFFARYRATSYQVTGGNADAFAWLTLSYQ